MRPQRMGHPRLFVVVRWGKQELFVVGRRGKQEQRQKQKRSRSTRECPPFAVRLQRMGHPRRLWSSGGESKSFLWVSLERKTDTFVGFLSEEATARVKVAAGSRYGMVTESTAAFAARSRWRAVHSDSISTGPIAPSAWWRKLLHCQSSGFPDRPRTTGFWCM